jgi:N-acetylmuramoyl-L-alanine amidase
MIAALALALQIGLVQPGVLSVRAGERTATVPLVQTSAGPALAADRLGTVIETRLRSDSNGRHVLILDGVSFELSEQVPFARIGADVVPMVGAPYTSAGRLHVPMQLVVELFPRYTRGSAVYDANRAELRVIRALAATPGTGDATTPRAAGVTSVPVVSTPASPPPAPASNAAASDKTVRPPAPRKRVVVVDAGHGGHDPGTSGRSRKGALLVEKDVALAVAKQLEVELRKRGVEVIMTRSTDVFIPLPERGRIANRRRGDLFISVHVNASAPRSRTAKTARGIETYFLAVAKTEDAQRVADMENASIRFEAVSHVEKEDPLSFIINDMAENEHLRESSELASLVQKRLTIAEPAFDRGVKQGPFRVLVTSYMPAVLVEVGYATNVDDATLLLDSAHQRKLAQGIANAAMDYFDEYDRRIGIGSRNPE